MFLEFIFSFQCSLSFQFILIETNSRKKKYFFRNDQSQVGTIEKSQTDIWMDITYINLPYHPMREKIFLGIFPVLFGLANQKYLRKSLHTSTINSLILEFSGNQNHNANNKCKQNKIIF